jgi:hypothetical protein
MKFLIKWGLIAAAAALMVFAACEIPTLSAAAYTGTPGLTFELITTGDNAGTYRVRWQGPDIPEEIYIPATHRADDDSPWLPVTEIGAAGDGAGNNGAFALTIIKTVSIPEGIKAINDSAFRGCAALAAVTIPASVTTIGPNAFSDCYSLTFTFAKGTNLQTIGTNAFYNCRANTSITIPASITSIGSYAFGGDAPDPGGGRAMQLASVTFEEGFSLERVGGGWFYNCGKLTSITIPAGTRTITDFSGTGLTSITIPASVTSISSDAFSFCSSLKTITFEKGSQLRSIASRVFTRSGITAIEIPASVTSIANEAFYWATSLKTITFEEGSQLERIGSSAFEENLALTGIKIPASLRTIGNLAFYGCTKLESVTFEECSQLETIGGSAFAYCCLLTKITIPASVTSINDGAFFGDRYGQPMTLASVTFEKGSRLQSIGKSAFLGCVELTAITIPASVTAIGDQAFYRDNRSMELASVIFEYGSRLQSIGERAFSDCKHIDNITIPAGVTAVGSSAFGDWTSAQTIIIAGKGSGTTADAAWGAAWRDNCGAAIIYQ